MEKKNYARWKRQYSIARKKERKTTITKNIIAILCCFLIFYVISLFWNDEIRFWGRKTEINKGVITHTEFKFSGGARGYYQKVTYQFIYKQKIYKTYFWANKFVDKQFVGDSIYIKFEVNNPNNSKYLSTILAY